MLEHMQETATLLRDLRIQLGHDRLAQILLVDTLQPSHLIRLGRVEELHQQGAIHGIQTVKIRLRITDMIPVMLLKVVHHVMLIVALRQNVAHAGTSLLPVTYS